MPAPTCFQHSESPLICLRCMGHRGGSKTTRAKRRAARENGRRLKRRHGRVQRIRLAFPGQRREEALKAPAEGPSRQDGE